MIIIRQPFSFISNITIGEYLYPRSTKLKGGYTGMRLSVCTWQERCSKCNLWVHYKKCSGLKTLSKDLSYECPHCHGVPGVRPVDGRPFKEVEVGDCVLEAVDRFCYLGDMLSAGGGCMAAATARCRCAWGKFRENLPLLTSKPVPFDLRGCLFSSNVHSSMLHGTETWPMTSAALHRLCRNDHAMICGSNRRMTHQWANCMPS